MKHIPYYLSWGIVLKAFFITKTLISKHSIEQVVPTGNIFILIELDGFERHTYTNDLKPNGTYRQAWVSGMQKKYLNISTHQHSEMLVIQFRPFGAFPFFKIPIHTLNNSVVQAQSYFGDAILRIRNKLLQTENATDKFQIIDHWLNQLFDAAKTPPREISEVVTNLQNQPFSKQKDVLSHYPKTSKHLIDLFKKYCGLTPKSLHRVFRFNKILAKEDDLKKGSMAKIFGLTFIYSLVMAFNLGMFLNDAATTISWGAMAGFLAGFGWVAMSVFVIGQFERKSTKYMLIHGGYVSISFVVMGLIIGMWR